MIYPDWICSECAKKYGNRVLGLATWHRDRCGICGELKEVTEPRDCGHLRSDWVSEYLGEGE